MIALTIHWRGGNDYDCATSNNKSADWNAWVESLKTAWIIGFFCADVYSLTHSLPPMYSISMCLIHWHGCLQNALNDHLISWCSAWTLMLKIWWSQVTNPFTISRKSFMNFSRNTFLGHGWQMVQRKRTQPDNRFCKEGSFQANFEDVLNANFLLLLLYDCIIFKCYLCVFYVLFPVLYCISIWFMWSWVLGHIPCVEL